MINLLPYSFFTCFHSILFYQSLLSFLCKTFQLWFLYFTHTVNFGKLNLIFWLTYLSPLFLAALQVPRLILPMLHMIVSQVVILSRTQFFCLFIVECILLFICCGNLNTTLYVILFLPLEDKKVDGLSLIILSWRCLSLVILSITTFYLFR